MATPKKILATLRKHIDSLNVPYREVERRAGLASGSIGKLLGGEMHLRFGHILQIGAACGVSALGLYRAAYGRKGGTVRMARLFTELLEKELEPQLEKGLGAGKFDERLVMARLKNLKVEE